MRIKDVTISGFHKITNDNKKIVPMDNCNIIVGNNGAGKTTIMQAIQWALLGYIPGTNKTKGEIFKHVNSNDMSVQVTFEGGDTENISRRLFQTGPNFDVVSESNVSDTFNVLGDLELPILNYDEFMGKSQLTENL